MPFLGFAGQDINLNMAEPDNLATDLGEALGSAFDPTMLNSLHLALATNFR